MISGGIGITPLLSMLDSIAAEQPHRQVTFIHATKNSRTHAFKEQVKQLKNNHPNIKSNVCYDSPTEEDKKSHHYDKEGFLDFDFLQSAITIKEAHFYICGSIPFMEVMVKALNDLEIPKGHIHFEAFSPLAILGEE
ncbi:hypothetical protein [Bacillus sp. SA1-12]|uniref:hypothetical protein n=1 Tax=Bacillus sp. SA1-12 TaxID=1455638 RepID=UPI001E453D00|nr:hypothetical protein [Bacillus sp. SA1-12]